MYDAEGTTAGLLIAALPPPRFASSSRSLSCAARCAIDMLAGPSEVLVIADSTANVEIVAADLLAQVIIR